MVKIRTEVYVNDQIEYVLFLEKDELLAKLDAKTIDLKGSDLRFAFTIGSNLLPTPIEFKESYIFEKFDTYTIDGELVVRIYVVKTN